MNKSIMFILLELFTIRSYRVYSKSTINFVRQFLIKQIQKNDDLQQFRVIVYSKAVMLSNIEFLCVRDFIDYLDTIDKIVKK